MKMSSDTTSLADICMKIFSGMNPLRIHITVVRISHELHEILNGENAYSIMSINRIHFQLSAITVQ